MSSSALSRRFRPHPVPWWEVVVLTLLCSRFYLPAEATEQGLTLWLAATGFLLLAVRMWRGWRHEEPVQLRWPSWLTGGLLLLVGGHLLSGLLVLMTAGDRRAALNASWEWLSVGALLICLRSAVRSSQFRSLFGPAIVTAVGTLSLLGIWQYAVWYPQIAAAATRLADLHAERSALTPAERAELTALEREIPGYVDKDQTGQQLFLSRLRSTEPIGRFALANTFSGLLIVGALVAAALLWPLRSRWPAAIPWVVSIVLIMLCLTLTASRTATVGLVCGLLTGTWWLWPRSAEQEGAAEQAQQRHFPWRFLIAGSLFVGLFAVIGFAALNPQRLTGPLLSLRYRAEYWNATLQLLLDHPLTGSGLGNFRPMYLQYKLPGSSEEILDPHNLVLDAWANGGLAGLVGLGILLWNGVTIAMTRRSLPTEDEMTISWPTRLLAGLLPILLVLMAQIMFEGQPETMLAVWLVPAGLLACLLSGNVPSHRILGWLVAWLALTVHLCGAGGLGMPAILQLWLALLVLLVPAEPLRKPVLVCNSRQSDRLWIAGIVASVALAVACLWTGVIPTTAMTGLMTEAELAQQQGQARRVESLLKTATELDPLTPEPWQRLSLHYMTKWKRNPRSHAADFERAIQAQQAAIDRDPYSGKRLRILGEWWAMKYAHSKQLTDAEQSLAAYKLAAGRYPNFAPVHAELATVLASSGQDPRPSAQRALELDDLNHAANHYDKFLPAAMRQRLEEMLQ